MTLARILGLTAAVALFAAVIVGLMPVSSNGFSCGAALAADDQAGSDAESFVKTGSTDGCHARLHDKRTAFGLLSGVGLIAAAGAAVWQSLDRDRLRYRNRVYDLSDDVPSRRSS